MDEHMAEDLGNAYTADNEPTPAKNKTSPEPGGVWIPYIEHMIHHQKRASWEMTKHLQDTPFDLILLKRHYAIII